MKARRARCRRTRRSSRRIWEASLLLEAQGLELAYGEVPACRDVSFNVGEGEIVTLIGANGAGKTTTLRAVAGAMRPRKGRIVFRGKDVTRMPAHERARAGVDLDAAKMRADLAIGCDVSSESDTRQAVEGAVQAFGALHVLVNAAATRDPTASV
ncbi:MAG: hypothetical protein DMD85_01595, partial [Candidatus Rokuibacteriota bacterium]